jgi:hypothetical protein
VLDNAAGELLGEQADVGVELARGAVVDPVVGEAEDGGGAGARSSMSSSLTPLPKPPRIVLSSAVKRKSWSRASSRMRLIPPRR